MLYPYKGCLGRSSRKYRSTTRRGSRLEESDEQFCVYATHVPRPQSPFYLRTLGVEWGGGASATSGAPGAEKSTKTQMLEMGAKVLQTDAPLNNMDVYLVGFHPLKEDPAHQMEAHHFCHQVNEDFAQCALFDGNTKDGQPEWHRVHHLGKALHFPARGGESNTGTPTITRFCRGSWSLPDCRRSPRRR